MTIPTEFTAAHIQANADASEYLFREFLRSGEPFKSMLVNNPWLEPPDLKRPLQWGQGRYWDTTVARKHSYWKDVILTSDQPKALSSCAPIFCSGGTA